MLRSEENDKNENYICRVYVNQAGLLNDGNKYTW